MWLRRLSWLVHGSIILDSCIFRFGSCSLWCLFGLAPVIGNDSALASSAAFISSLFLSSFGLFLTTISFVTVCLKVFSVLDLVFVSTAFFVGFFALIAVAFLTGIVFFVGLFCAHRSTFYAPNHWRAVEPRRHWHVSRIVESPVHLVNRPIFCHHVSFLPHCGKVSKRPKRVFNKWYDIIIFYQNIYHTKHLSHKTMVSSCSCPGPSRQSSTKGPHHKSPSIANLRIVVNGLCRLFRHSGSHLLDTL